MNRTSAGEQGKPGELVGAKGPAGSQDLLPGGTISNRIESLRTATKTALKKSLRPAKARLERELNRVSGNLKGQLDSANRIIAEQAVSLVAAREALLHLDARLMALEDRLEAGASVDRALDRRIPVPVLSDWAPTILGYLELVGGTTTKLLHVNSGDGGLALLLQQKGLEVVAVDPDASCVWSALERGVRAHLSDAFTFLEDPAGPSFDSIIMSGVVDVGSIEDRALLATYALRRLHPG
ncbi:MAG TPA: class I SAM-dependent methyltransferase, partial [Acidimicrobiales bacterium]|nr:class I SAM-dependent methyltransferase [Acidimicrobiales bacterium]